MPEVGGFGDPEKGWYWIGRDMPDLPAMQKAHDQFTDILRKEGVDVVLVGEAAPGRMKQIFTRDSVRRHQGRRDRDASCPQGAPRRGTAGDPCAGTRRLPDRRQR